MQTPWKNQAGIVAPMGKNGAVDKLISLMIKECNLVCEIKQWQPNSAH